MFTPTYARITERLSAEGSDVWAVHERALKMQRNGDDVILLSVGDPDFRTPEPIIDNAVSHLRVGRTHYSPSLGEIKLRRAVADLETQSSPHPCTADEVAIFPGATSAIHAVLSCLLNPGDEIVVPEPMYVGYNPIFRGLDLNLRTTPLDVEHDFALNVETLKSTLSDKTRVLFINTPGNPTGAIIPASDIRELAAYCLEKNIWLVCDEVYSMFCYEGKHMSARASAECLDNVVMIDGLSKSHAMSGWRIGWVVAPPTLIERLGEYAGATLFGSPQFIQDASAFALENDQQYVKEMRNEYRERRDYMLDKLSKVKNLHCSRPHAGMFIMCDVSRTGLSGRQFADQLLEQQGVSVIPGAAFGPSAENFVRLGLAQNRSVLKRACKRIKHFCASL
ncbi:pyridoxal phosphate-dependent aminotransferase [Congregibacter variabilis]|uniref:Aminotransferase n=1 Tax=Congregibacter variabilis TaxID=3081200 RepID=A0ABZ0I6W3_9GAMM|nr:pyridoxal phosphate-dependent aminotransferase [Congregibacter sp. IMCC43200]